MTEQRENDLIGRETELLEVSGILESVGEGPAALVVEGEAGIGKTVLWKRATGDLAGAGYRVLRARPTHSETAWSFSGLTELLLDQAHLVLDSLPPPQRGALGAALLIEEHAGPAPNPLAVALAIHGALQALTSSGPVVLAIDDATHLDPATADALGYAIRRLASEPVGLFLTIRPEDTGEPLPTDGLPEARVHRMRLSPLSVGHVETLLRRDLGTGALRPLVREIHRISGGNPLFAIEIGRALLRRDTLPRAGEAIPLPQGLRDLVADRLAGVEEPVRDALAIVAAASEPTMALVARALGPAGTSALADAEQAGLVEVEGSRIRFTNPLIGSVLYDRLGTTARERLHGTLARVVDDPEERARHLARSTDEPDEEIALALEEAARGARARGAPLSGAELAEAAGRLTAAGNESTTHRRLILAAELHLDAGNLVRSRDLLEGVVSAAEPGPVRAAAMQRLGWVRYHEDSWADAAELFEAALAEAGDDPTLEAAIELDGALSSLVAGDVGGAASRASRARDLAAALGDAALEARATAVTGSAQFLMGQGVPEELMESAMRAETWARPRPTLEYPSVALGVMLKMADDLEGAGTRLREAEGKMREAGTDRSLPFLLFHLAELETWRGDLEAAARYAAEANDIALRTGQESSRAFTLYAAALVAAHRGALDEARAAAEEGLALAERSGTVPARPLLLSALGLAELSGGDSVAAHRYLGPLAEGVRAVGVYEPGSLRYLGDAIEAMIDVGELDDAEALIDMLEERASALRRRWALAVSSRCRGLLAARRGDLEGAVAALQAASEMITPGSHPLERGRTLLCLGMALRRQKRKRPAREALEEALAIFQELGSSAWADRARAELGRISGRAPAPLALTRTEERVADLVANGATNREVAQALFLSEHTVEWNLSRIYRKLGVRSRSELARWRASSSRSRG